MEFTICNKNKCFKSYRSEGCSTSDIEAYMFACHRMRPTCHPVVTIHIINNFSQHKYKKHVIIRKFHERNENLSQDVWAWRWRMRPTPKRRLDMDTGDKRNNKVHADHKCEWTICNLVWTDILNRMLTTPGQQDVVKPALKDSPLVRLVLENW
jgi:hypothetical protein